MSPRPARRRRAPRALWLFAILLLLLVFFAPVDWKGLLHVFTGGDTEDVGGGASAALDAVADGAPAESFDWSAALARLAAKARAGESAAEEARLGETWRALASAVETALASRDVGGARRALAMARASWLREAPRCAAAAEALSAELEETARTWREAELARLAAELAAGRAEVVRTGAQELLATGDEAAFAEAIRLAATARGTEPAQDGAARAQQQALAWRRAAAGSPSEALLSSLLALALQAEAPTEALEAVRLAHELTRCAYPVRRVQEDLEGAGVELRWQSGAADGSATLRSRGGGLEIRAPGSERFEALRVLDDPDLVQVAGEVFAPLGLDLPDARAALAALLARSGEREAALRLLAMRPAMEGEERARFLAVLGG